MHLSWQLHCLVTNYEMAAADGARTDIDKNAAKGSS